jgi:hypothetical protein
MEPWLQLIDDGPERKPVLVCSWCHHIVDDPHYAQRRATTLAASQRQFHVGD